MKNGYSLASESLDMTSYLSDPAIKYFPLHGQFGREWKILPWKYLCMKEMKAVHLLNITYRCNA